MYFENFEKRFEVASDFSEWASTLSGVHAETAPLDEDFRLVSRGMILRGGPLDGTVSLRQVSMTGAMIAFAGSSRVVTLLAPHRGAAPVCARATCGAGEILNHQVGPQVLAVPPRADFLSLSFPYKLLPAAIARIGLPGALDGQVDNLLFWIDKVRLLRLTASLWGELETATEAEIASRSLFSQTCDRITEALAEDFHAHLLRGRAVRADPLRSIFVRCHALLESIPCRAVPVQELSMAVNASEQRINEAFGETVGVNPRTWHTVLRLLKARGVLRRAEGDRAKVSEVAHKFGFTHLGRFSTAYQKFFREYPSATLKTPVPAFD